MFQKVDFPALQAAVILDREELESKTRIHFADVILADRHVQGREGQRGETRHCGGCMKMVCLWKQSDF